MLGRCGVMYRDACISDCGRYRYALNRTWAGGVPNVAIFAMLNPSTADADIDDPTIRRCVAFAKSWGCNGLDVVNLFSLRATDPKELLRVSHDEAVGPLTMEAWERTIIEARRFGEPTDVAAGGALHRSLRHQADTALGWLDGWGVRVHCLGLTKEGLPRHPLYLPKTAPLRSLDGAR